ncbi:MAG: putative Ig domain-containing protein [Synergistaceae bacterium]|nr:putative Ig domain-containing protein [Synergistaceae bacterium]
MNRKLRVLMLSLAVVMFSVASAFAAFESSDVASFVVSDSDIEFATTEGYNYMQRVFVDPDAWPEGETPRPVTWIIDPNLPSWLTYVIDGNTVTFRGILPAYDASKESYTVHAIASLDCDVVIGTDSDDEPITAPGHIEADVDMDEDTWTGGLVIEVEQAESPLGLYADLVSIDASAVDSRDVVGDKYSVLVNFPMSWTIDDDPSDESDTPRRISTDLYPNAQLECEQEGGRYVVGSDVLNLPQWLDYEVVSTQRGRALNYDEEKGSVTYPDDYPEDTDTTYVKTLRIFFTSRDYQPENDEKAVVRIVTDVSDVFSDTYEDGVTIGWNVTYRSVPKIVIEPETRALTVERGESADTAFDYSVVAVSGDPTFSPAVTGVTFTPTVTPANSETPSGKIDVHVDAASEAQAGATAITMTVNDANGGTVTAAINLTIVNPITIDVSGDKLENVVVTEGDAAKQYTYTIGNPLDGLVWAITGNGASMLSPTSGTGNVVSFTLDPTTAAPGNYTATLEAHDNSGRLARTQTFTWTVQPLVKPIELSYDDSDTVSVDFGASADLVVVYTNQEPETIIFSPDISADVKLSWDKEARYLNGIPAGIITIHAEPVTPRAKLYSTDIIVTDSGDNTASLPIFISVDVGVLSIEPVSASVSVELNTSKDVSFNAINHSGVVSWDIGTVPSGITVTESVIPHATQYNANGLFTVTGAAVGTYSVDITATDERGEAVTATLYVDVTPRIVVTVSPDEAAIVVVRGKSKDVTFTAPTYSGDVTWTLGTLPTGVTVTPATHTGVSVDYTVTAASTMAVGTYSVDITATDATGSRNATLNVNVVSEEPKLLTVTPASADASVVIGGASANVSFAASNNSGDVTWTLGTLPTGVTVAPATNVSYATQNNTRMVYTVTATSTAVSGDYSVTVTAKDSGDKTATATINVKVSSRDAFTITPSSSTVTVNVGSPVSVSFTVSGDSGTLSWSASGLPAGVSVNPSTGVISGTPTAAGNYTATVTARNTAGRTATATITITVVPGGFTIRPSSSTVTVRVGSPVSVSFTASGASGTVTWSATGLPAGVDISSSTGAISGTPTTAGSYSVSVTASAGGRTANATVTITVTPIPDDDHGLAKLTIDVTDEAMQSRVRQSLSRKLAGITGTTSVVELPSSAMSGTVSYGTDTVRIPTIVVPSADIYVFGVSLDVLQAGYTLVWTPHASNASTGEYIEASDEENNAVFFDDSGNETTVVPASKHVNVAAYFEPGKAYEPAITATSSDQPLGVGGSGGGCDAGLGAIVLAMAATFFISKKRS